MQEKCLPILCARLQCSEMARKKVQHDFKLSGSKGGRAGVGKKKRRGPSSYYSKLSLMRKNIRQNGAKV